MKLVSFSKNPLGAILAAVHWIIAVIALLNIQVDKFDNVQPKAVVAFAVSGALFILDLPAIISLAILFLPFYLFGELYFVLVAIGSLFVITLQWLTVGRKIRGFFDRKEQEILTLEI